MTGAVIASHEDQLRYALAGDATLTLRSLASGLHLTFRVWTPGPEGAEQDRRGVSVRCGSDDWLYVGMVFRQGGGASAAWGDLSRTRGSRVTRSARSFVAFDWFWRHVARGREAPKLEVRHEGACGRCGRALTHPVSLETGLGPVCTEALGVPRARLALYDVEAPLLAGLGMRP